MNCNVDKGLGVCFTGKSHVTAPTWFSRRDLLGHKLDLSDTSGVTYCTQSANQKGTSGSDSFRRRTETDSTFQGCFERIDQFACVAADAVFAGLLFLEIGLKSSGVFFLKRNGNVGKGRIDPSLKNRWHRLCKAVVL